MAVNRELVERKMGLILTDLEKLRDLGQLDLSEYLTDYKNEVVAERLLERIIGRMIDINYHLASEETLSAPTNYHDSFTQLEKLNILKDEDATRFAKLAGLRNRLSHEYNGIDEKIIYQAVKELVAELPTYIEGIKRFTSTLA
jgi:uncharacterized protein YutE (UPF0331/DUF86 family)